MYCELSTVQVFWFMLQIVQVPDGSAPRITTVMRIKQLFPPSVEMVQGIVEYFRAIAVGGTVAMMPAGAIDPSIQIPIPDVDAVVRHALGIGCELGILAHIHVRTRPHTAATEIKYRVVQLVMSEANDARLWRDLEPRGGIVAAG